MEQCGKWIEVNVIGAVHYLSLSCVLLYLKVMRVKFLQIMVQLFLSLVCCTAVTHIGGVEWGRLTLWLAIGAIEKLNCLICRLMIHFYTKSEL